MYTIPILAESIGVEKTIVFIYNFYKRKVGNMPNPKQEQLDEYTLLIEQEASMVHELMETVQNSVEVYKVLCEESDSSVVKRMYMNLFCNITNTAGTIATILQDSIGLHHAKGRDALLLVGNMIEGLAIFLYAKRYRKDLIYFNYMNIKCLKLHFTDECVFGQLPPHQESCKNKDIESLKRVGYKFIKSGKNNSNIIKLLKDVNISPEDKITILKQSYKNSWAPDSIGKIVEYMLRDGLLIYVYERYNQTKHHTIDNFFICTNCNAIQIKDDSWDKCMAVEAAINVLNRFIKLGSRFIKNS